MKIKSFEQFIKEDYTISVKDTDIISGDITIKDKDEFIEILRSNIGKVILDPADRQMLIYLTDVVDLYRIGQQELQIKLVGTTLYAFPNQYNDKFELMENDSVTVSFKTKKDIERTIKNLNNTKEFFEYVNQKPNWFENSIERILSSEVWYVDDRSEDTIFTPVEPDEVERNKTTCYAEISESRDSLYLTLYSNFIPRKKLQRIYTKVEDLSMVDKLKEMIKLFV